MEDVIQMAYVIGILLLMVFMAGLAWLAGRLGAFHGGHGCCSGMPGSAPNRSWCCITGQEAPPEKPGHKDPEHPKTGRE